jgi:hypothetical protein
MIYKSQFMDIKKGISPGRNFIGETGSKLGFLIIIILLPG